MQRLFTFLLFFWSTEAIVSWSSSPSQVAYEVILQLNETAAVSCVVSADQPTPLQIKSRRNATGKLTGKSSSTICLEGTDCALQVPMIAIGDLIWCTADGLGTVEPSGGLAWADPAVPYVDSGVALAGDVDQFWLLFGSTLVFFMQIGFASLEAGICRVRNVTNMLYVNFVDCGLSAIIFWSIGWAFSFGGDSVPSHQKNGFISYYEFFLVSGDGQLPRPRYMLWLFQWAFCSAAATIVTGAIAERARVIAYFTIDTVVSAWIYPVIIHWMWSNHGWLSPFADNETHKRVGTNGVIDFAGSCSVHLCGGTCSLVGAVILGPRKGRFSKMPETPEEQAIRTAKFQPHNRVLTCLGAFFLWFGWYGFNACSTLIASNSSSLVAGKVAVTTTMGTAGGIFGALVADYAVTRTLGLDSPMNGSLIGLVSVTSGCSVIEPWAALLIGFIGGMLYVLATLVLEKVQIDDPVGAVPVHFMGGLWGTIAPGLFCTRDNLKQSYNLDKGVYGLFYGGGGQQLGVQILGAVVVMAWSGFFAFLTFFGLKMAGLLRVPEEVEEEGLDTTEHGASVYNDDFTAKQVLLNTQGNKENNRLNGENYYRGDVAFQTPAHTPNSEWPNTTPATHYNDIPV